MELMASTLTNQIAQQPKANERSQATSDVRKASSNSEEKNSFQSKLNEKKSWAPDRGRSSKLDPSPRRRALPKQVGQNQSSSRNSHQEVVDPNVRKSREPARKNGKAEAVDSLTRRAALQSFMMKMKQDLDVNPGEVV
ncbi:MAG: hypothetical protein HRT45_19385, partial [Bdellovibrionales bacterium]|nr:hypothetical protein [Bdellovibrionales bacterium]